MKTIITASQNYSVLIQSNKAHTYNYSPKEMSRMSCSSHNYNMHEKSTHVNDIDLSLYLK